MPWETVNMFNPIKFILTLYLELVKGDVITLRQRLYDGWWKCDINGTKSKILIADVKGVHIRREKSEDNKLANSKSKKSLSRQTSKDESDKPEISRRSHSGGVPDNIRNQSSSPNMLISPRQKERSNVNEPSGDIPAPPPLPGQEDENKKRQSMRKRASRLLQGSFDKFKDSLSLTKSDSSTNLKKNSKDKKQRRGSVRMKKYDKDVGVMVYKDLKEIQSEVEIIRIDIMLIMKAMKEIGIEVEDKHYLLVESPDQKMLNRMLESPYSRLFSSNDKVTSKKIKNTKSPNIEIQIGDSKPMDYQLEVTLGISKPLLFKEILIPMVNLGAIGDTERDMLKTLEFDIFPHKDNDNENYAFTLLMSMFYEFNLPKIFRIPDTTLYRFLYMISRRYRSVPFHNFYHAFNVTQTLYFFICQCQMHQILGPLEILALLIATIAHDCDHPGLNNDFQRKAHTKIFHMHRKSVLENHHYLQCMSLLAQPETNILMNLEEKDLEQIRIYLRDLILATDLAVHGLILKSLKDRNKVLAKLYKSGSGVGMNEEDKKLIMCAFMKCADLSNEIRDSSMSKKWAKLVYKEFLSQSKKESELNIPLTPFMNAEKIIVAKEQMNFIENICLPLYNQMALIFQPLQKCCEALNENRGIWKTRLVLFFNDKEINNLPNKSLWERDQVSKTSDLSTTLAMRATNSVPTLRRSTNIVEAKKEESKK